MTDTASIQLQKPLHIRYPLLFKLLLLFIFFLPLRGVQIPIGVFGFEINPSRIASVLMLFIIGMNICLDTKFFINFFRCGKYRNPYIFFLFIYFLFSIIYYYILVALGKTILFGSGETFFLLNWQGRPFAQLISFITYGLIPFYCIKRYAQNERMRASMERVLTFVILLLLSFACLQVITYIIFRMPLIGRQLLEYKYDLGAVMIFGIPLYRVNSLAGEPRDFGTFLLGAIPLYIYMRYGKIHLLTRLNILLMVCAFFLTVSNSAFFALGLSFIAILGDVFYRRRVRIRLQYLGYGVLVLCILFFAFRTQLISVISKRTIQMYDAITAQLETERAQPIAQAQAADLVILYYILDIPNIPPLYILFGYGYSNFVTPMSDLLEKYFNSTIGDVGVFNPNISVAKLFAETGIVGIVIYSMMFFYTLKMNARLLYIFHMQKDKRQYQKALLLRLAFITFFIAGSVQNAYYYFIPMGLIVGWLNGVVDKELIGESKEST